MSDNHHDASIICTDIVESSRYEGVRQAALARDLRRTFDQACNEIGLSLDIGDRMDRGDSEVIVVRTGLSPAHLVAGLCREFGGALQQFNRHLDAGARLRIRMAIHRGVVVGGAGRWDGHAVVDANRILNARRLRDALADSPTASLAVGISDAVHAVTVRERLLGLDPVAWSPFEISKSEKGGGIRAWAQVDGRFPPPARTVASPEPPVERDVPGVQVMSSGPNSPNAGSSHGNVQQNVTYGRG